MAYKYKIKSNAYFMFNDVAYAPLTEIELTDEAYLLDKYFWLKGKQIVFLEPSNLQQESILCMIKGHCQKEIAIKDIKRITNPVLYEEKPKWKVAFDNRATGKIKADTFNGWAWFVVLILFSLITTNPILAIGVICYWFVQYLIDKYYY